MVNSLRLKKIFIFLFLVLFSFNLFSWGSSSSGSSGNSGSSSGSSTGSGSSAGGTGGSASNGNGTSSGGSNSSGSGSSGDGGSSGGESGSDSGSGESSGDGDSSESGDSVGDCSPSTISGISSTASSGGSLSSYSVGQLAATINSLSQSPGNESTIATIQAEIDSRHNAVDAEVQEAENDLSECVKNLTQKQAELDAFEKERTERFNYLILEGNFFLADKDQRDAYLAEAHDSYVQYQEYTKAVENAQKQVSEAYSKYSEVTKKAADYYASYEAAGDPVRICNGDFLYEAVDFCAEDFLEKFTVERKLSNGGYTESFGKNWICSLDSRIVRCRLDDFSELIENYEKEIPVIDESLGLIDAYNTKHPRFPSDELDELETKWKSFKTLDEQLLSILYEIRDDNNSADVKNIYAAYGRYSSKNNLYGTKNIIKYVDKNGEELVFIYQSDGNWVPAAKIVKGIGITGRKSDGSVAFDNENSGGFIVSYKDGKKIYYDSYGLLEKEVDRNGNQVVYDKTNGKVTSVRTKTGENISIKRNGSGFITSVSGPVSGNTVFTYSGSLLVSVVNNENVKYSYAYDSSGFLTKINKADGKSISIGYEMNYQLGKNVVSKITNENGNVETFVYKPGEKTVIYKNPLGYQTKYKYNEFGNTIYVEDSKGQITKFTNNSDGLIVGINENGFKRSFSYDSDNQISKVSMDNGAVVSIEYDNYGKVIRETDSDGFSKRFNCDSKGNVTGNYYCGVLISTCTYYSNGLLKSVCENGCTYSYKYNAYGSITERQVKNEDGKVYVEKNFYDEKNRLKKYVDFLGREISYSYGDFSRIENCYGLKEIKRSFDKRNREIKSVEKDLRSGKIYEKSTLYDGCGNVLKIFLDGELFCEYEYDSCGRLSTFFVWNFNWDNNALFRKQSLRTEYEYDSLGFILSVRKSVVGEDNGIPKIKASLKENDVFVVDRVFVGESSGNTVIERNGNSETKYQYDKLGRLKRIECKDGFWKSFTYSKAGRLICIEDSNGNRVTTSYKSDGSKKVERKNGNGYVACYNFDVYGKLVNSTDFEGNEYNFSYNWNGNITEIKGPGYKKNFSYDCYGNLSYWKLMNLKDQICFAEEYKRDFSSNTLIVLHSGMKYLEVSYDAWNRPAKVVDKNGERTFEYDALGNCTQEYNGRAGRKLYYSPTGELSLIINSDESYELNQFDVRGNFVNCEVSGIGKFCKEYSSWNKLSNEVDFTGNEKKYVYSQSGMLESIFRNDSGNIKFKFNTTNNAFSVENENGDFRKLYLGTTGEILRETDFTGDEINYSYNKNGELKKVVYNSGVWEEYIVDKKNGIFRKRYSNGDTSELICNPLGKVKSVSNSRFEQQFLYDNSGLITEQKDVNMDFIIKYEYDNFCRKIKTKGNLFEYSYDYDSEGNVICVTDEKNQNKITISYDLHNREIKRSYSNGITVLSDYDKAGRKILNCGISKNGDVIFCKCLFLNELGKIQWGLSENGEITKYEYDNRGRLIKVISSFSEEIYETEKKEYVDCGGYIKPQISASEQLFMEEQVRDYFDVILKKNNLDNKISIQKNGSFWWEEYSYTKTGCIKTSENPFGKIIYEYDKNNRLIKKHVSETENGGIFFGWDKDGRLKKIENYASRVSLEYGSIDKPVFVKSENLLNGEVIYKEYSYDGLGRLTEISDGKSVNHLIYEGVSSKVLVSIPVMKNGTSGESYFTDNDEIIDSTKIALGNEKREDDYKIKSLSDYEQHENYKIIAEEINETQTAEIKINQSFTEKSQSALGNCFSILSVGDDKSEMHLYADSDKVDFIFRNYWNNLVAICDNDSECNQKIDSNVWGFTSVESDFLSFGNSICYLGFNLFDFGERIYSPLMKCFISEDRKRDGGNYYAYCATDPVNYEDVNGNYKKGSRKSQNMIYAGTIAAFTEYNQNTMRNTGTEMGIPKAYNCADVSAAIDAIGAKASGMEGYSPMAETFSNAYFDGDNRTAMDSTQSKDYYTDTSGKNVTKTSSSLSDLTNPEMVTPGTVLVWSPDPEKGINTGHTATVISRDYDDEGNVCGLVIMEGHLSENTYTELEYVYVGDTESDVKSNHYNIKAWRGNYEGTYEIESSNYAAGNGGCGR